jgi:hypothetical protein
VVVGVEEEEEGETGDGDEDDKESLSESVWKQEGEEKNENNLWKKNRKSEQTDLLPLREEGRVDRRPRPLRCE